MLRNQNFIRGERGFAAGSSHYGCRRCCSSSCCFEATRHILIHQKLIAPPLRWRTVGQSEGITNQVPDAVYDAAIEQMKPTTWIQGKVIVSSVFRPPAKLSKVGQRSHGASTDTSTSVPKGRLLPSNFSLGI
jgi:hypothetical protein